MIRCLKLAEPLHPSESDAVVDDPKQLLIGVALHLLTGEVRSAWVHPLPRWRLGPAIDTVAYAAIQTVMCTSCLSTGPCINRWWGNTAAAGQQMADCLTRFATRVSRKPGSFSAAKLKCINPIPISTTPEATIVRMIRDRIGFSCAAG